MPDFSKLYTLEDAVAFLRTITGEWPEDGAYPGPFSMQTPNQVFDQLMLAAHQPITLEAFLLVMNMSLVQVGQMQSQSAKWALNQVFQLIGLKPITGQEEPSQEGQLSVQELILAVVCGSRADCWAKVELSAHPNSTHNAWHHRRFVCLRWQVDSHYLNRIRNLRRDRSSTETDPVYGVLLDAGILERVDRYGFLNGAGGVPPTNLVR